VCLFKVKGLDFKISNKNNKKFMHFILTIFNNVKENYKLNYNKVKSL